VVASLTVPPGERADVQKRSRRAASGSAGVDLLAGQIVFLPFI